MAKQKARDRGDRGGGENKNTGLVVSLVVSILLAITLGVFTYLGYSGKSEAEKQAKAANDKATAAEKKAREEEAGKLALKTVLGTESDADRQTLNGRKAEAAAAIQAALAGLKSVPAWNGASEKPPKSYEGLAQELRAAAANAAAKQKAADDNLAEEQKKFKEALEDLQGKHKVGQDNLKKSNDALVEAQNTRAGGHEEASKKIKELSDQLSQLTLDKQNLEVEKDREIRNLRAKIDSITKVRSEFQSRVGPLMEKFEQTRNRHPEFRELGELYEMLSKQFDVPQSLANDTPKGQITQVQRQNGMVYINLGTADYVRPGLTFSVLPAGSTGKTAAGQDRKGAIEIVSVLEPHLSAAKAVEVVNPVRDPLMAGDLLFNPAWAPGQRMHVALAGIIDINGDGNDDAADLMRSLAKQGVVVDAYLDLKDRTVKGPGLSEKTTYLILGEKPTIGNLPLEGNKLTDAAVDIIGKMEELKTKARELGVQPVAYRRYLALIGYRLPKSPPDLDLGASSYLRGIGGRIKPVENGGTTPKEGEEKPK